MYRIYHPAIHENKLLATSLPQHLLQILHLRSTNYVQRLRNDVCVCVCVCVCACDVQKKELFQC